MDIRIVRAEEKHVDIIVDLIREFAVYEKLAHAAEVTAEDLRAAMFEPEAFVSGLIALDGLKPAGYALFYPCFATFRGQRGMWLEDILCGKNIACTGSERRCFARSRGPESSRARDE